MPTMRPLLTLAMVAAIPVALAGQARAQARTGTGGGPATTVTAPNTSTVGRTKPPGSAAAAEASGGRARRPAETQDDRIQGRICVGCGAK